MIMSAPVTRTDDSEPPASVDEELLVRRARRGDLEAYDELVRLHQERIYATVYHMTANHEDANDLAQESFIKAFQALKSFKGGSSFYTWLYRIAVNKTINFLKQRKNRIHMSLDDLDFRARPGFNGLDFGQNTAPRGWFGGIAGKIERGIAEVV
jgi:RNA polymerase sigma-70 factor (ECF subfamily)